MIVEGGARRVRHRLGRYRNRLAYAVGRRSGRDVLFVSGPGGDARRYRCDHQAEQLALAGLRAGSVYRDGLVLERLPRHHDCVVLYRVPWDDEVARVVEAGRGLGRRVLADVDDLVFAPGSARFIRALELLDEPQRAAYVDGIARLRRTLSEVDGVSVSTEPLARAAARVCGAVAVTPNAASAEMVERGRRAREQRRPGGGTITVAYLSGTPTHDRDFLEAADGLLWALDRYPHVRFLAVGHLSLDERFGRYRDRVERIPRQPWDRLPSVLARVDVNLAPLERDNPFTDAKSCVKYLEAAVVGVPTIASPRTDFARVIDPGVTGLLADEPDSWRDALGALVDSASLRERLGAAAFQDVREHHSSMARARSTAATFRELLARGEARS
jgi:glycosyltransferase involved in cell wall biosynthesis